jgi:hypothetical protein
MIEELKSLPQEVKWVLLVDDVGLELVNLENSEILINALIQIIIIPNGCIILTSHHKESVLRQCLLRGCSAANRTLLTPLSSKEEIQRSEQFARGALWQVAVQESEAVEFMRLHLSNKSSNLLDPIVDADMKRWIPKLIRDLAGLNFHRMVNIANVVLKIHSKSADSAKVRAESKEEKAKERNSLLESTFDLLFQKFSRFDSGIFDKPFNDDDDVRLMFYVLRESSELHTSLVHSQLIVHTFMALAELGGKMNLLSLILKSTPFCPPNSSALCSNLEVSVAADDSLREAGFLSSSGVLQCSPTSILKWLQEHNPYELRGTLQDLEMRLMYLLLDFKCLKRAQLSRIYLEVINFSLDFPFSQHTPLSFLEKTDFLTVTDPKSLFQVPENCTEPLVSPQKLRRHQLVEIICNLLPH